jgi:hypothetical protein
LTEGSNGKFTQKKALHSDVNLKEHCEQIEDDIFDHQRRLTSLREGAFTAEKNTIFSAIFEELKRRKNKGK